MVRPSQQSRASSHLRVLEPQAWCHLRNRAVSDLHANPAAAVMDHMIQITHTYLQGSLVVGTNRGDSAAGVLRPLGWRWSPTLTVWYLPRSRDRVADRVRLDAAAAGLVGAGLEIVVSVDDTIAGVAEREDELSRRGRVRAERFGARAERAEAEAAALNDQGSQLRDRMPSGQPLLAGAAGGAAVRRHYERVVKVADAGADARARAKDLRAAAAAAEAGARSRNAPLTVVNRITRLERELVHATDADRGPVMAELEHWRTVRAGQVVEGRVLDLGPGAVRVGDRVQVGQRWYTVAKTNPKTITVEARPGTSSKVPYTSIQGHQPTTS